VDAEWKYKPTDCKPGEEAKAKKILAAVERDVKARADRGEANTGPMTVHRYFKQWADERERRKNPTDSCCYPSSCGGWG